MIVSVKVNSEKGIFCLCITANCLLCLLFHKHLLMDILPHICVHCRVIKINSNACCLE